MNWQVIPGDCREVLATLDARSVQTCVTSPPYFGLRDYGTGEWDGGDSACDHRGPPSASATASTLKNDGRPPERVGQNNYERQAGAVYRDECGKCGARRVDRQIGLEPSPDEFVAALVGVFREVRRVLRDDGTVWLNLGDSYANDCYGSGRGNGGDGTKQATNAGTHHVLTEAERYRGIPPGVKKKDLLGIPWMVAFALRADGWYLRSDIIWAKPNPMPESVTDRPTKSHEHVFLLSKGPRYFYDATAIRELAEDRPFSSWAERREVEPLRRGDPGQSGHVTRTATLASEAGRNKRSVWTVSTMPYPGAHFATFPPKLIEPCILAGSRKGDVVLDPFAGAGTTGVVALQHGRSFVGIELNAEYARMARERIALEGRPGGFAYHEPDQPVEGQLSLELSALGPGFLPEAFTNGGHEA